MLMQPDLNTRQPGIATGEWIIKGVDPVVAREFLRRNEPWRRELRFENGPCSSDFSVLTPFIRAPLNKLRRVIPLLPPEILHGRVLDVGSNIGHNGLFLAANYAADVTGIELSAGNRRIATELANILAVRAQFILGDAEKYEQKDGFDLILHFGTLYHLRNPVSSLEKSFRSLKPGGYIALETMCYKGISGAGEDDNTICKWVYGFGGDYSNSWALGKAVIESVANYCRVDELKLILEIEQTSTYSYGEKYENELTRCIWLGRRAA